MAEVMTTRLGNDIDRDLTFVAKAEHLDKSTALRRLLTSSLHEWKQEHALKEYSSGKFSAEQAARFIGISLWAFFDLLKQKKISLSYDVEELERDLRTIQWKK